MRKSRLSTYKQYKLIEHFVARTTARCASTLVNVNKNTAALYFQRLRELISHQMEKEASYAFEGEIEVDESYSKAILETLKKAKEVVELLGKCRFLVF